MPRQNSDTVRHVPTDEYPRCGTPVDPKQGRFLFHGDPVVDEETSVESGIRCTDCFAPTRAFVTSGKLPRSKGRGIHHELPL